MNTATTLATAFKPGALTWADILADRRARGLEKPARKAKVLAFPGPDPRLPNNVKPHSEPVYNGPRLTPGRAKTERKRRMQACGCRLCALALTPPATFAEAASLGIVYTGLDGYRSEVQS